MYSLDIIREFSNADILYDHRVFHFPPPSLIALHTHECYELLYFVRGNVSCDINGDFYRLRPHDLVLTRPSQPHQIVLDENTDYERYLLQFSKHLLPEALLERLPADKHIINTEALPLIYQTFQRMDAYCEKLDNDVLCHLFPALVCELIANFLMDERPEALPDISTAHPTLDRALSYIDQNLQSPLTVEHLCRELYVTKGHLHHLFLKHLQTTPRRYIVEKRLFRAKRELRQGKLPTLVAQECGFADYTSFYRNYKFFFGYAPSEEKFIDPIEDVIS